MEVESSSSSSTESRGQTEDTLMWSRSRSQSPLQPGRRNKRRICLWATFLVMIILGLLFLILGLTVFKVKHPVMIVNSVAVRDLDFSLDIARVRVVFNVTLDVHISIKNPNMVGFKYTNSTAFLRYRGNDVGQVPINAGRIGARHSRSFNITLSLMGDRLLANSTFYSDVISGTVTFQNYIRVAGKVRILFFSIHVVSYTTCDLDIHPAYRNLSDPKCHYKTKL
ncbi:hypothetical protein Salat_0984600 [Sesamum alatum]|uniref:Late embryogenesis abundant protein LEA-2 subgroup domain-containing protein n=1 Tax=Sesamum alatum TaxID=300844 RepID=A0AAE1YKU7_9LAMI|nr:hypothetical protein Salat_0984600 [Sesamum alatum]